MYTKFKIDQKIKFQMKFDDMTPEEYCFQQFYSSPQIPELNVENFFSTKSDRCMMEDRIVNENLFLQELKLFSLKEHNDSMTLSSSLLENEAMFEYYLNIFSNEKAFLNCCTYNTNFK